MRIAYLTADFGVPVLGTKGASVHVRRLVGALAERGHEVCVLTPTRGSGTDEPRAWRLEELPFTDAPLLFHEALKREALCQGNRLSKDLRNLFYSLWLEGRAAPLLAELQPDLVYERYTLFGTAGVALARQLDVPHLLEVNAPLVEEQREQRGLALPDVALASQRMVFEQADELLVVSRWLEGYVREHGAREGHVTVVPNAADPERFQPRTGPSELRRKLGWEGAFVLGFVGAMKPWQGVDALVAALHQLGAPAAPFRLLLVGDGPALAGVQARVAELGLRDAVHCTGALPHDAVPDWLGAVDVALVPFTPAAPAYFSPVKLFEYMAMGLPVVAARRGQTEEILAHGRTGWLYDAEDPREPAATLRQLATQPELRRAAGQAARDRVLAEHTWERNAQHVERLAARALERRARVASRSHGS
jgi:glycosyltransferase involved in cell wall biosynthesis